MKIAYRRLDLELARVRTALPSGPHRVAVHRRRLCPKRDLYHIALELDDDVFHHGPGPWAIDLLERMPLAYDVTVTPLPDVAISPARLRAYESGLPKVYLVGVRDCRHHTIDLLRYLYP